MKVIQTKIRTVEHFTSLDLNFITIGEVTTFDIFIKKDNNYLIIIEAGTLISESLYDKLKKQLRLYMKKIDKNKTKLTCESLKFYMLHNKDNLEKRISLLYKLNDGLFTNYLEHPYNKIDLICVDLIVKSIVFLIKYDDKFLKNTIPYFINEHCMKNHSLHVAIYAMSLGNGLGLNNKKLLQLGTAGLLHDIGLKKINESLLNKSTTFDISELEEVKKHVTNSVDIIKQNNLHDPDIIDAVLHHHEQYDGNGYPNKLSEVEISVFASILAICDVFDALTSSRPHRKQYTSFEAIKMMLKDESMVNKFNQSYLQKLLKLL
ncbi:metal dependent phosphohydrolase [Sulfurimonas gotlandica GD1]|uniref:Metal dependent phosphohydrolase n=1 Tax=Sulfurimonas gotlandica (strain DSM 19862 / JCM 16533 / GD1) TaxID=929558 RepID=B6BLG9_SULGG|nr:HD domain-containing phosphohydrolase [Sulfurimonas gotlandica]EDZ62160.1 metal dependent phosphohydrolase [Sulfurimonas gotlandica GD1]EHP28625.1 metal dependent phosphohydrolase [Sulfurimonas gotlandica GD1]